MQPTLMDAVLKDRCYVYTKVSTCQENKNKVGDFNRSAKNSAIIFIVNKFYLKSKQNLGFENIIKVKKSA
jgi:hypothetical protein